MDFLWFLSQFRTPFTEEFFQAVTLFGQQTLLIVLICICFWCINKELAFQAGFTFCLSGTLVQGLKLAFRIPRPWILDPDFKPVQSAVPAATGYSFPSGHTQSATAIYGTAGYKSRKPVMRLICFAMVLLIGFSRMFLGVHTPKDVLFAILLSVLCIWLVEALLKASRQKGQSYPIVLLAVVSVLAIVLYIYGYILASKGTVALSYAYDCAETTGAALGFVVGYLLEERFVRFDPKQKAPIQVTKCVVGLLLLVVIQKALSFLPETSMFWLGFENLLLILFITFFYPFLFQKILLKRI